MAPKPASNNTVNLGPANSIQLGKLGFAVAARAVQTPDCPHIILAQSGPAVVMAASNLVRAALRAVPLPRRMVASSLRGAVAHIRNVVAEEQVRGVDTGRVVTAVADHHPFGNGSDKEVVRSAVRARGASLDTEQPVALATTRRSPEPAGIWLVGQGNLSNKITDAFGRCPFAIEAWLGYGLHVITSLIGDGRAPAVHSSAGFSRA